MTGVKKGMTEKEKGMAEKKRGLNGYEGQMKYRVDKKM